MSEYGLEIRDSLSAELQSFLIRLGKEPSCVSEKVGHYVKHILHLLPPDDERLLIDYYGLFGNAVVAAEDLAHERHLSMPQFMEIIQHSLRRLAVTPEWQMIKQLI